MPEQFGVIPAELRAVSRRLADVGDRIARCCCSGRRWWPV